MIAFNAETNRARRLRVLIIHQNFPGQFRYIASFLASQPDVEVLGIGKDKAPGLANVRYIKYRLHRPVATETHPYSKGIESAVLHGQAVLKVLLNLNKAGYVPDVVLAHPGWGETLYLKEVYPDCKLIHLCEWYYSTSGVDAGFDPEFKNSINNRSRVTTTNSFHLLSLEQCDIAISPTQWQKKQFPANYQHKIQVMHEGINTQSLIPSLSARLTMPNGKVLKAGAPVITYVARNLEPYRGFHILMRTLPLLLKTHPQCEVVIVGADGVSYGSPPKDAPNWREKLLQEVSIDQSRVHFLGKVPYPIYQKVLQISAAHIYLTYPFVLSWSLLEAMATGCLVIASNTAPVKEVIEHGKNGLLVDFFSSQQIVDAVSLALTDKTYGHGLRRAAMRTIQQRYALMDGIQRYAELILNRPVDMTDEVKTTSHQAPVQIILSKLENGSIHGNDHRHVQTSQPQSSTQLSPFARRASDKLIQYQLSQIGITQRELEILKCLSLEMEDKSISTQLQISTKTVNTHVSSIINKLGANNRTHAVAKVFHSSMLDEGMQVKKTAAN